MLTFKNYIVANYSIGLYHNINALKNAKKNAAKSKNQWIFLQRCVKHCIIPRFLRIKNPLNSKFSKCLMIKVKKDLLLHTQKLAKKRYFNNIISIKKLEEFIKSCVNNEDFQKITNITDKSYEYMFLQSRNKLKNKFDLLIKESRYKDNDNQRKYKFIKEVTFNLCADNIPTHHKKLLDLGPNFVPIPSKVPYMDIISINETAALKLKYSNKNTDAHKLRQDVLRVLKIHKPVCTNLDKDQFKALKELKSSNTISIYPFDKGSGFVRIKKPMLLKNLKNNSENLKS
ncbi:uncharacterized protein LOC136076094 [Hydra vulgaris]|uniref:Uncharacterized protein LOC136076094 n=1 Tax=Hydra vulgaris TaxID=6087 RepID=A0ABM4B9S8_HYDVU